MRRMLFMWWVVIGCNQGEVKPGDGLTTDEASTNTNNGDINGSEPNAEDSVAETIGSISMPAGHVMDPKLSGDPSIQLDVSIDDDAGCPINVLFTNGIGQLRTIENPASSIAWDGRDHKGDSFDPGPVRIELVASCAEKEIIVDETRAYIVRLGLSEIDFESGDDNGNVGLAFHKRNLSKVEVNPVGDRPEYKADSEGILGSPIDHDDGQPKDSVSIWTHPDVAPWIDGDNEPYNVPTGYIANSTMRVQARIDAIAVSQARSIAVATWGPTPDEMPAVRLAENGQSVHPEIHFSLDVGTAPSTMGRHTQTIEWRFESESEDGTWHPIPGAVETAHAFYVLVGEPALLDGRSMGLSPDIPWVGVLDDTATVLEGVPATVEDTLDALRDYLFEHDYVVYDPSSPTYTDYEGVYMYWSSITAQVSAFLDRREGLRLYCHSMSCMLSALAGNHGVRAEQIVLGVDFYTNFARAAGTDSWGRWGFNSHSVVTPDDGETIWDSSIALDGDGEPGDDESIEEIMPRGMDGEEYMWRLTYDDIEIINQGLCYIE